MGGRGIAYHNKLAAKNTGHGRAQRRRGEHGGRGPGVGRYQRAHAPRPRLPLRRWLALLLTWQYSAPFAANLCASASFFALLGAAPISVAVPVTNAVTFAATAVAAAVLGERVRPGPAVLGTGLIVLGVWICIS
ncbi:hypothetical protein EJB05_47017, partial [Eragrostis curvula]